jgi:hypothetical protein
VTDEPKESKDEVTVKIAEAPKPPVVTVVKLKDFDPIKIGTIAHYRVDKFAYNISEEDAVYVCYDIATKEEEYKLMTKSVLMNIYMKGDTKNGTKRRRKTRQTK